MRCSSILGRIYIGIGVALSILAFQVAHTQTTPIPYRELIADVSELKLRSDITQVAGFGNRISGSDGEKRTIEFAQQRLEKLGFQNFQKQPFLVTVPDPESRGILTSGVSKTTLELYPLWPNGLKTNTCNLSGNLLYAGFGSLPELKGKEVSGRIAILEFNSGSNWKNLAKLGASAVIFIAPENSDRLEAEAKFVNTPITCPRFYVSRREAAALLGIAGRGELVQLRCKQPWIKREVYNLTADLPAKGMSNQELITLSTYADSISIVPGINPGIDSASGIISLFQILEGLRKLKAHRPVRIVVFSGHFQALRGEREWVKQSLEKQTSEFLHVSLDLSSTQDQLATFARGWLYDFRNESVDRMRDLSRKLRSDADQISSEIGVIGGRNVVIDAINETDNRSWKNNVHGKFATSAEPMILAGLNAMTIATVDTPRLQTDTPFDRLENLNLGNLASQTKKLIALLSHVLVHTSDPNDTDVRPIKLRYRTAKKISTLGGFSSIQGKVVELDSSKNFVPDQPIRGSVVLVLHKEKALMGVRPSFIELTDPKNASFDIPGLSPQSAYPVNSRWEHTIYSLSEDAESGKVNYAPMQGLLGGNHPLYFPLTTAQKTMTVLMFRGSSRDLYDLHDPQDFRTLMSFDVLDAVSVATPKSFSLFQPYFDFRLANEIEDTATLFYPADKEFRLIMGSGRGGTRLVFSQGTQQSPTGTGLNIDSPKVLTSLQAAKDLYLVNESRIRQFQRYKLLSKGVLDLHNQASSQLKQAESDCEKKDWLNCERQARSSWGYSLRVHPIVQGTVNEIVKGVVFYLLLLLPFSYFLERLLIASKLLSHQIGWTCGLFILSFVVLQLLHPAFELIRNPTMIFVAFVMGTLSTVVATFILSKFEESLKQFREIEGGIREIDVNRSNVAFAAFALGLSNLRRRKTRTIMTTLTLIVLTYIVLSFTSIVPELTTFEQPNPYLARYSGILLREPTLDPLQASSTRVVQDLYNDRASVSRRSYYFGADLAAAPPLAIRQGPMIIDITALVGYDASEQNLTRPQEALLEGGRWFRAGETSVAIIPASLAEALRFERSEVGKGTISFGGVPLTVIGIVEDSAIKEYTDLDGDGILAPDLATSRKYQQEFGMLGSAFRSFLRLDPSTCVILPTDTVLRFGGQVRSIAVGFSDPLQTRQALNELMPRTRLNLYASVEEDRKLQVKTFSSVQGSSSSGFGLVLIQLCIAGIFVFNTMIASVYERKKEISIFSAIGLAPNHISGLFFIESLIYAILGVIPGYFLAQATAKVLLATQWLPSLNLNFSAYSSVAAALMVFSLVLLSTIYPARVAKKIAAPAKEDDFFGDLPEGDRWELELPFRISGDEALPLARSFAEWLRSHEGFTLGSFVSSEIVDNAEKGSLSGKLWLSPFDLGVSQHVEFIISQTTVPDVFRVNMVIERLSGEQGYWHSCNRQFLPLVRKHFLTWRTTREG